MDSAINDLLNGRSISLVRNDIINRNDKELEQRKDYQRWICEPEAWSQYNDETIYQCDKLVRAWIEDMSHNTEWKKKPKLRKYTFGMLFEMIYGRKYNVKEDAKYSRKLVKIFSYYSTKIQKHYYNPETKKTKSEKACYTIMTNINKKPPYSIKLRVEWLQENNMNLSARTLKLPKDDLIPGHARNPKTEQNMEKRRELARKRYNDYVKKRKENPEYYESGQNKIDREKRSQEKLEKWKEKIAQKSK